MGVEIIHGDCLDILPTLSGLDACVCDPPYHLTTGKPGGSGEASLNLLSPAGRSRVTTGFMGKQWDGGDVALRPETWALVLAALKPGAHLLAFSGTRTQHRMVCAIEDAGFEIRDTILWITGSGFPKSHDVSKGIDKAAGAVRAVIAPPPYTRGATNMAYSEARKVSYDCQPQPITAPATPEAAQWQGWGTALKPAVEMIVLARKPLSEKTIAANVLRHGTGAINIDACRIPATGRPNIVSHAEAALNTFGSGLNGSHADGTTDQGRWPANVLHDCSEEVEAAFAAFGNDKGQAAALAATGRARPSKNAFGDMAPPVPCEPRDALGTASRFFYSAKADADDRAWSKRRR